jgi:HPt (histidine-containing phosphotransfer) domain-containing protein
MDSGELYNLTIIKAFVGNNKKVIDNIIDIFLNNTPEMLSIINKGLKEKDYNKISFYSHKLKSSIDSFSINELKSEIRLIENISKEKSNLEELPQLINNLNDIMNRVIQKVKDDFHKA